MYVQPMAFKIPSLTRDVMYVQQQVFGTLPLARWQVSFASGFLQIVPNQARIVLLALTLNSALFHGICPARFTSSSKLLFSPERGLGAPLSSYVEMALYEFLR